MSGVCSAQDLADFAKSCLEIHNYHQDADDDLRPLLINFGNLGRQLNSISNILQTPGRSFDSYFDPDLGSDIRDAGTNIRNHFEGPGRTGIWSDKVVKRSIGRERVKRIYKQVDKHTATANTFKTDQLLRVAIEVTIVPPKSDAPRQDTDSVPNTTRNSGSVFGDPFLPTGGIPPTPTVPAVPGHHAQRPNSWTDINGAFELARVVFEGQANVFRNRRAPVAGPSNLRSTQDPNEQLKRRDRFVQNVVSVIDETQLYAADTVSQQVLEKLKGIVGKAVELQSDLTSPEMAALEGSTMSTGPPRIELLMSEPYPSDDFGNWSKDLEGSSLRSGPDSISLGAPALSTPTSSISMFTSDEGQQMGLSTPELPPRQDKSDFSTPQIFSESRGPGSVSVCVPSIGIGPTSCTLEIAVSSDEIYINAFADIQGSGAALMAGSANRAGKEAVERDTDPSKGKAHELANPRLCRHIIMVAGRPIPSVPNPDYEGPELEPSEPYTITFTKRQSLRTGFPDESPQQVRDLKYIFWDKAERDRWRSLIFGKDLLFCTCVQQIRFNQIACSRKAISLWFDRSTHSRTVTFLQGNKGKSTHPEFEAEYTVIGAEENKKADELENHKKPFVLKVIPLLETEPSPGPFKRSGSIRSALMATTTARVPFDNMDRCLLYFPDKERKIGFTTHLKQPIEDLVEEDDSEKGDI